MPDQDLPKNVLYALSQIGTTHALDPDISDREFAERIARRLLFCAVPHREDYVVLIMNHIAELHHVIARSVADVVKRRLSGAN